MQQEKIKPLGSRVLVKRSKTTQSKGGILLPDSAQEKPKQGTVVACGSGKVQNNGEREQMFVKVGDCVLFSSYAGTEVKVSETGSDDEYLLMNQDDLLGVIEGGQ